MLKSVFRTFILSFILTFAFIGIVQIIPTAKGTEDKLQQTWWSIQSVDTMKYSRDLAWEKLSDRDFDAVIDQQVRDIASLGSSHIAIATPYDEQFIPYLTRWVTIARKYGLSVWFRGNFSGWEQWFNYDRITREEHLRLLQLFIVSHPDLFQEGDVFTPCPECENGGPGDPRKTGDVEAYRQFLIDEYETSRQAFRTIGKGIDVGYFSMNYDVAKLIMDKQTTEKVGGTVTIDHYVKFDTTLLSDIREIARKSGGKVFLGEFGAPIPDIHGDMTETQQADWIGKTLSLLAEEPELLGLNYWVNIGGSTKLWNENGSPRKAVVAVKHAFTPIMISGTVVGEFNNPIANATVTSKYKSVNTDRTGRFNIPILPHETSISVYSSNYIDKSIQIDSLIQGNKIIIQKNSYSLLERILSSLSSLLLHK